MVRVAGAETALARRGAEVERLLPVDDARELLAGDRAQRVGPEARRERAAQERHRGEPRRCRRACRWRRGSGRPGRWRTERSRSETCHQDGVEEEVGRLGGDLADVAEVADAGVGEDQPRAGVAPREVGGLLAQPREPAAGVEEHRRAVLVGERDDALDDRVRKVERVAARMQLEADRAGFEAARRGRDRRLAVVAG